MQCETGEYRYRYLSMSVRSADRIRAVLVRFETDDDPRPFGILEIMPDGGTFDPGNLDYPYRYTTTLGAAHVRSSARYPTNDVWTEAHDHLQTECAPYPCFRVISVKAIGDGQRRADQIDRARADTTIISERCFRYCSYVAVFRAGSLESTTTHNLPDVTRELGQPVLHDDERAACARWARA